MSVKTRIRRNKIVEIPEKWIGVVITDKTKRDRKIKAMDKVLSRRKRLKKESEFDLSNQ